MNTSHLSVAGSYLIMSPGPGALITKFEKKNAFCAATQVGPSFQSYLTWKPPQMSFRAPTCGAGKGPGGQKEVAAGAASGEPPTSGTPTSPAGPVESGAPASDRASPPPPP